MNNSKFSIGGTLREPPFKKPNDVPPQSFQDIFSKSKAAPLTKKGRRRAWK
jgi:hypothetical protein